MLKAKITTFAVLVFVGSVAFADKSSENLDSLELKEIEPLSSEEAALAPKANWQPICQEVLINQLESKPIVPESEVVFLPQEIPGIVISPGRKQSESCIAPNGGGLTTFLREAYELLPHDRLNAIKQQAANDPEVKKFADFLKSENFRKKFKALLKTNAFVVFRDYACQKLYLDVGELLQFGGTIFDLQPSSKRQMIDSSRGGLLGLLSDIKDALPKEEFKRLLKEKLKTDEYLRKAKDLMQSCEFIAIAKAVNDQPEFVALIKAFGENGFKFEEIVEYARTVVDSDCKNSI